MATKYHVLVDDNFHAFDASHRGEHGGFESVSAAIAAAKRIVDESLTSAYKPGITADELLKIYKMYGDDPFIVAADKSAVAFSAWDYAAERSAVIANPKN